MHVYVCVFIFLSLISYYTVSSSRQEKIILANPDYGFQEFYVMSSCIIQGIIFLLFLLWFEFMWVSDLTFLSFLIWLCPQTFLHPGQHWFCLSAEGWQVSKAPQRSLAFSPSNKPGEHSTTSSMGQWVSPNAMGEVLSLYLI